MNVLVIGAHPDDYELGMGGTIKKHFANRDNIYTIIMSYGEKIGEPQRRKQEALKSAKLLGIKEVFFLELEDTKINCSSDVIGRIEDITKSKKIERVYTHSPRDTHQDHRNTSNATLAAARNVSQIIFYESPSSDLDFRPTFFVDIEQYLSCKIKSLKIYKSLSKLKKRYLEIKAIQSSASFRGYQSKIKFAEGFEVYKFIEK